MKTNLAGVFAAAAMALAATGCSAGPLGSEETITVDEATQRVEEYIADVAAALPGSPALEPNGGTIELECRGFLDRPGDTYMVSQSVFLRGLPEDSASLAPTFVAFTRHLTERGFDLDRERSDIVVMTNPEDDFTVSLQEGGDATVRGLSVTVGSPCARPDGLP